LFVSAVTTPATYPEDITEGAKLFSLVNGMWVLCGIMVLLTLIFGAYALRKPVKVRTLSFTTIVILPKEKLMIL
jgi:hypothetical protein